MELIKFGIRKHPYISVSWLWAALFCIFGYFNTEWVCLFNYIAAVVFTIGIIPANEIYLHIKHDIDRDEETAKKRKKFYILLCIAAVYLLLTLFAFKMIPKNRFGWGRNPIVILVSGLIVFIAVGIFFKVKK